jgi:DNA-binding MarR family transcriptional regulator
LYACAKGVVNQYTPLLERIGLTYTQYIVMMVLWEHKSLTVKELGARLLLDSGTLTPVLKRLETNGLIVRARDQRDERNVIATITENGMALREKALDIPKQLAGCLPISFEESKTLYSLLYKILNAVSK